MLEKESMEPQVIRKMEEMEGVRRTRLEFPPSKKQKAFRVSELCRIPRYAREQFGEDPRQSINFAFSRKPCPVRNRDSGTCQ